MTDIQDIRERVWKVIRCMTQFTYDDVKKFTEESSKAVTTYLLTLYQAGYIHQAGKKMDASGKRKNVWRLIKNTGPKPPIRKTCLYDPNDDSVYELKGPGLWVGPGLPNPKRRGKRHVD